MENRNCGSLWILKNDAFTFALDLKSNETYTIGTNSNDNIRLKVQTFVPESSILKLDKNGFVKFTSNGITDCQINDKPFQGVKYLIPGDVVNLMGKKLKYKASTLSNEHIDILQNKNKKHFDALTVKRIVKKPKPSTPMLCHNMCSFNFKEEIIKNHPITPSRRSVHKPRFKKSFKTPRSARKANKNEPYSYFRDRKISLNFGDSKIVHNIDAIRSSDEDQPPDLTPLTTGSSAGDNLSYVQDNRRLTQELIGGNRKNKLGSETSVEMENVTTCIDSCVEDSVFIEEILKNEEDKVEEVNNLSESVTKDILKETEDNIKSSEVTPFNARVTRRSIYAETPNAKKLTFSNLKTSNSDKENFASPIKSSETPLRKSILKKTPSVNREIKDGTAECPKLTTPVRKFNMMKIVPSSDKREVIMSKDRTIRDKRSKSILVTGKELASIEQCPDIVECTPSGGRNVLNGNSTAKKLDESALIGRKSVGKDSEKLKTPRSTRKSILSADDDTTSIYRNENTATTRSENLKTPRSTKKSVLSADNDTTSIYRNENTPSARSSRITCNTPQIQDEFERISETNSSKTSTPSNLSVLKNESFVTLRTSARRTRNASCDPAIEQTNRSALISRKSVGKDSEKLKTPRSTKKSIPSADNDTTSIHRNENTPGTRSSRITCHTPQIQDEFERISETNSLKTSTPSNLSILKNEAFVTLRRSARRTRSASYNPATEQTKDVVLNDSESSTGSSSGHYDSDRDVDDENISGIKLLDNPFENSTEKLNLNGNSESSKRVSSGNMNSAPTEGDAVDCHSFVNQENASNVTDLNTTMSSSFSYESFTSRESTEISPNMLKPVGNSIKENFRGLRHEFKILTRRESINMNLNESLKNTLKRPRCEVESPKSAKKLKMSTSVDAVNAEETFKNDLTNVESIKDLLNTPGKSRRSLNELSDHKAIKELLNSSNSPAKKSKNDLTDVRRIKKLMATPKAQKSPENDLRDVRGVRQLLATPKVRNSPTNDLTNIAGVKRLMATPKHQNSPANDLRNVGGVKKLMATPKIQKSPKNDLTNVAGVKKIMATPKVQKPPKNDLVNIVGVKKMFTTPKQQNTPENDLTNIKGVKKLMATPKAQRSPENDLTNIKGVKKMMATPKAQRSPENDLTNIKGVKKMMATPKAQKSPKNDLTNIKGVKKLMATPKAQRSPENDLTNIKGVKKMMATPKAQRSPENDLTNIKGVKKMMATPKAQRSPENDLTNIKGVKKMMATPKAQRSPENDLTDIRGVKKMMATPKLQKSPKNDLVNIVAVKKMLATPKQRNSPRNDLTDVAGVEELMMTPRQPKSPLNDSTNIKGDKKMTATPNFSDVKGIFKTPKHQKSLQNDLCNITEVKKLLATHKIQKSPSIDLIDVAGDKKLMATPKQPKSPLNDLTNVEGAKKMMATPKARRSSENYLTDVTAVKGIFKTPKHQNSPQNDLSNIVGIKKLLATPKTQKSPVSDLSNITAVKGTFATPKVQKPPETATPKRPDSPNDDLENILDSTKPAKTPKTAKDPENDYRNVAGVKKLFATPKIQNPPKNSLDDLTGVKDLYNTPKQNKKDLSGIRGVKDLFHLLEKKGEDEEIDYESLKEMFRSGDQIRSDEDVDPFDVLVNRQSVRTYKAKSVSPNVKNLERSVEKKDVSPSVAKWVEDQGKLFANGKMTSTTNRKATRTTRRKDTEDSTLEETKHFTRQTRRNKIQVVPAEEEEETNDKLENGMDQNTRKRNKKQATNEESKDPIEEKITEDREDIEELNDHPDRRGIKTRNNQRNDAIKTSKNDINEVGESDEHDSAVKRPQRGNREKKKPEKKPMNDESEEKDVEETSEDDGASTKRSQRGNRGNKGHESLPKKRPKKNDESEDENVKDESDEDDSKRSQRINRGRERDNLSKKKSLKNDDCDDSSMKRSLRGNRGRKKSENRSEKRRESDEDYDPRRSSPQSENRGRKKQKSLPKKKLKKNDESEENKGVKKIEESDDDSDTSKKPLQKSNRGRKKKEILPKKQLKKNDESEENEETDENSDSSKKPPQKSNRGRTKKEILPKKELKKKDENEENEDVKKIEESDEDTDSTKKPPQKSNRGRKKKEILPKKELKKNDENEENENVKKIEESDEDSDSGKKPSQKSNRGRKKKEPTDNEEGGRMARRTRKQSDTRSTSSGNSKEQINEAKRPKRTASKRTLQKDITPDKDEKGSSRTLRRRSDRHAPLPKSLEEYEVDLGHKSKPEQDLKRRQQPKRGASKIPTDSDEGPQIRKSKRTRK